MRKTLFSFRFRSKAQNIFVIFRRNKPSPFEYPFFAQWIRRRLFYVRSIGGTYECKFLVVLRLTSKIRTQRKYMQNNFQLQFAGGSKHDGNEKTNIFYRIFAVHRTFYKGTRVFVSFRVFCVLRTFENTTTVQCTYTTGCAFSGCLHFFFLQQLATRRIATTQAILTIRYVSSSPTLRPLSSETSPTSWRWALAAARTIRTRVLNKINNCKLSVMACVFILVIRPFRFDWKTKNQTNSDWATDVEKYGKRWRKPDKTGKIIHIFDSFFF